MAVYKADILDVELNTGNIARSFLCHNIGKDDTKADRFGVRVYRDGEPESLSGCSIQGYMMRPNGTNLAITGSNTGVSGNEAWVDLPQAAYDYEGQFCLALKLIGDGVTGTIRIIDGMINNTFVDDALVPMQSVPTYQEILAVYDQMVAAKNGSVRFDQSQSLTETQKSVARMNIDAARDSDVADLKSALPSIANKFYTIIPNNTDYDTLTTPGTYLCTSATSAQGMTHAPSSMAHKMYVITTTAGNKLFQIAFSNDTGASCHKRYYNGSTWTEWKKFAITDDIPTAQVTQNTSDIADLLASTPSISNTRYTIIQDGTNYDTLVTPGTYLRLKATGSGTLTNPPSTLAHKLYVITTTGPDRLFQLAFCNSASSQIFKRYYNGKEWKDWLEVAVEKQTEEQEYRVLILGDSYSEQGRWVESLQSFINVTSLLNLGVSSASLKDKYQNRTQYPYTSRPNKNAYSGNLNTFMCQIEKLKRLMAGTDLDSGEEQVYTSETEYPNVIIIEGGQNDSVDTDVVVETYPDQFMTLTNNVYVAQDSDNAGNAELGSIYLKTPAEDVNRTCFAGAYRALVEELQTLFPEAQIFATSRSLLGYWKNENRFPRVTKIREQQELSCNMCGINFINWQSGTQVNTIRNYPKGSGTQADPYLWGEVSGAWSSHDTYDLLHPTALGAKKYAQVVANAIKTHYIEL